MKIFSQLLSRIGDAQKRHAALFTLGVCAFVLSLSAGTLLRNAQIAQAGGKGGPPPTTGVLTLFDNVFNNYSGTAVSSDATVHVKDQFGVDVVGSPQSGDHFGTVYNLPAGNYTISQDPLPGYATTYFGDCDSGGNISIQVGTFSSCSVTNTDLAFTTIIQPTNFATIAGTVDLTATTTDPVDSLSFIIDQSGSNVSIPATLGVDGNWHANWDTAAVSEGSHAIIASGVVGGTPHDSGEVDVTVQNVVIVFLSPTDGETVSGNKVLHVQFSAPSSPSNVRFNVDFDDGHAILATDNHNGTYSATIDTTTLNEGSHAITFLASVNGSEVIQQINVTVDNFQESIVSPTPTDGSTIFGTVHFAASVTGSTPDAVQFNLEGSNPDGSSYTTSVDATYDGSKWDAPLNTTLLPEGSTIINTQVSTTVGAINESFLDFRTLTISNDIVTMTGPVGNPTFTNASDTFVLRATVKDHSNQEVIPTSLSFGVFGSNNFTQSATYNPGSHDWSLTFSAFNNNNATTQFGARAFINGGWADSQSSLGVTAAIPVLSMATITMPGLPNCFYSSGPHAPPGGPCTVGSTIQLAATTIPVNADAVTFTVTPGGCPIGGGLSCFESVPATYNGSQWVASIDLSKFQDGFVDIAAIPTKTGYPNQTAHVFASLQNQFALSDQMVSPQSGDLLIGNVLLTADIVPTPDSADFILVGPSNATVPATYNSALGLWTAVIDTASFQDGQYDIRASGSKSGYVNNISPVFVVLGSGNQIAIKLVASDLCGKNSGSSKLCQYLAAPTQSTIPSVFTITSPSSSAILSGPTTFSAHVDPAKSVVFKLFSTSGQEIDLPLPKSDSAGNWTIVWDASQAPNGSYTVVVESVAPDGTPDRKILPSNISIRSIRKSLNADFDVALSSPTSSGAVLNGSVSLSATTTKPVGSVWFELDGLNASTTVQAAPLDTHRLQWTAVWNSSSTIDGAYALSAIATSGTAYAQSSSLNVRVKNTQAATSTEALQTPQPFILKDQLALAASIDKVMRLASVTGTSSGCISGSRYQSTTSTTIYYCGVDQTLHAFPNSRNYFTWFTDFKGIVRVSPSILNAMPKGIDVEYRPGRILFKTTEDPKVYLTEFVACALPAGLSFQDYLSASQDPCSSPHAISLVRRRWIRTEDSAKALFGGDWAKMVIDVPQSFIDQYANGTDIRPQDIPKS